MSKLQIIIIACKRNNFVNVYHDEIETQKKVLTIDVYKRQACKLPLSLNQSLPKSTGFENSTIQACMPNIF